MLGSTEELDDWLPYPPPEFMLFPYDKALLLADLGNICKVIQLETQLEASTSVETNAASYPWLPPGNEPQACFFLQRLFLALVSTWIMDCWELVLVSMLRVYRRLLTIYFFPDENCKDKYYNCNVVVQARLCVYTYYKTACCVSCLRVANRQSGFLRHR